MKTYEIITCVNLWSSKRLADEVQTTLNEKTKQGYEVINVSFDSFFGYTAYISVCK